MGNEDNILSEEDEAVFNNLEIKAISCWNEPNDGTTSDNTEPEDDLETYVNKLSKVVDTAIDEL